MHSIRLDNRFPQIVSYSRNAESTNFIEIFASFNKPICVAI